MRLPALCACLLLAVAAAAGESPEAVLLQRLAEPAVLRGDFTQSRQIAGFRRPVESSGRFVVARGQGLLWQTVRPFASLMSINGERLRVSGAGQDTALEAQREPMLRTLNELLQSVVVADVAALRTRFELDIRLVGSNGWEVTLQPRDAALRARFAAIDLAGTTHVDTVVLRERSGDVTTIRLSAQREDRQLTAEERGQFR